MKRVRNTALCVAAFLLVYLLTVASWAWASFQDAIRSVPPVQALSLSSRQATILLLVEDPDFYQHPGLSLAPGQGLATITGAVARDLFLAQARLDGVRGGMQGLYRAVFACCKQIDLGRDVMALVLDARMSKRAQLDYYMANVYMGTNGGSQVKGLAQAAQAYLGKPLAATTEPEFIRLVAMIKGPDFYHPMKNPAALAQRTRRIEALLDGRCAPTGWLDTTYPACERSR